MRRGCPSIPREPEMRPDGRAAETAPENVRQFCKRPEKEEMALIIGIDLGTTNSLAAYYTDQGAENYPQPAGKESDAVGGEHR